MKRWLTLLLSVITVISLVACSSNKELSKENSSTNEVFKETESVVFTQPAYDFIIDTEYYTLSAPSSWEEDCFYEVADGDNYNYTLSLYDKISHDTINGGWLFSIDLLFNNSEPATKTAFKAEYAVEPPFTRPISSKFAHTL